MRIISQFLLTFLLNSFWQIALIAALAGFGAWLLRNSAVRYRHWVWVGALCLAFLVPAITLFRTLGDTVSASASTTYAILASAEIPQFPNAAATELKYPVPPTFQVNQRVGFLLLALFCLFILYRIFKLVQAWEASNSIRRGAIDLEPDRRVAEIISMCERQAGTPSGWVKVFHRAA